VPDGAGGVERRGILRPGRGAGARVVVNLLKGDQSNAAMPEWAWRLNPQTVYERFAGRSGNRPPDATGAFSPPRSYVAEHPGVE